MILRYICLALFFFCLSYVSVNSATTIPPITTPTPRPECRNFNGTCGECVKHTYCIYCFHGSSGTCQDYPVKHIIPRSDDCDLANTRWATCALNYKALLIGMGTVAGLILLSCSGGIIYCCYCKGPSGRQQRKWAKEDGKEQRKKDERVMKQEQKKADRKAKNDEIRRKYGLSKDDDGQYHRMEED